MPTPFPPVVVLSDEQRQEMEAVVRAGSTPQAFVFRARLVLRAAESDHPYNLDIAHEVGCHYQTVAKWRGRYLAAGIAGLQDAARSGRPRSFSPLGASRCDRSRHQPAGRP